MRGLDAGWAKVQEVRQALLRCKKAGKDVICLVEDAGDMEYYLACAAGQIDMTPAGELMLMGLRLEAMFAKDLLDKIDVKGDFVAVGKYKGSPETFTRSEPSAPFRESLDSLVQDYFDQLVTGIVEGRKMPVSKVGLLIRQGPSLPAARRRPAWSTTCSTTTSWSAACGSDTATASARRRTTPPASPRPAPPLTRPRCCVC